jgi:hypothetical protein
MDFSLRVLGIQIHTGSGILMDHNLRLSALVASDVLWSPNLACGLTRSINLSNPSVVRSCSLLVAGDARASYQSSASLHGAVGTCCSSCCNLCRRLRASALRRTSFVRRPLKHQEGPAFCQQFGGRSSMFRGGLSQKSSI